MKLLRLSSGTRFWEIDILRGMAIIVMIVFHLLFDLNYFTSFSIDLLSGFWFWLGRIAATVFLLLPGISLTLAFHRKQLTFKDNLSRGLQIFSIGILITLITFFLLPQGTIWFGILHSVGLSIILGYFFIKKPKLSLAIGSILIVLGIILMNFRFDFPFLLWLGFFPKNLYSFDYFPLLPWLGVMLIGIFLGNKLYPNGKRSFQLKQKNGLIIKILSFMGRNSLIIYLIHQPILIFLLKLLRIV